MGDGDPLRLVALAALALLCAPPALADDPAEPAPCDVRSHDLGAVRAYHERCGGSAWIAVSASAIVARVDAQWEHDEEANYTSLGVAAPPRYVGWHEDEHGCALEVGLVGREPLACPASPPPPPVLP